MRIGAREKQSTSLIFSLSLQVAARMWKKLCTGTLPTSATQVIRESKHFRYSRRYKNWQSVVALLVQLFKLEQRLIFNDILKTTSARHLEGVFRLYVSIIHCDHSAWRDVTTHVMTSVRDRCTSHLAKIPTHQTKSLQFIQVFLDKLTTEENTKYNKVTKVYWTTQLS